MKENAIKKINSMGSIGGILVTICKVIMIIAATIILAATIAVGVLPKDFVQFTAGGNGSVTVDLGAIDQHLTEDDITKINSGEVLEENNAHISINSNGNSFRLTEMIADGDTITISGGGNSNRVFTLQNVFYVLIIALITVIMSITSLFFGGAVCKAFKVCQSPFEENVIRKMRNFALSLLPWVVLRSITESAIGSLLNGSIKVSVTLDVSMLIIVLVLLALVYIFKYGAILQRESDETL